MHAALTGKRVSLAALAVLVVALILGSVQTTGAMWTDQADSSGGQVQTGNIGLSAGDGSGTTYTFAALNKPDMAVGESVSASLNIVNTGSTPLRYRLASAAPSGVTPGGTTVVMELSGTLGTCPGAGIAFAPAHTPISTPSTWLNLPEGGSQVWCITAELVSVTPIGAASFTLTFHFDAEQTRP